MKHSVLIVSLFAIATPAMGQLVKLTTGSGGGERQPVVSADGRVVAYLAMSAGTRELFTIPTKGGTATARTTGKDVSVGYGTFDSWTSISMSANGRYITYWNLSGVHLVDTVSKTDTVVAKTFLIPYPRLDTAGKRAVWQSPVNNQQEVFVMDLPNGTPKQITTTSGAGRRLPVVDGGLVLFQKTVGGWHELFLHDVQLNKTTQLTTNSGPGNRYGNFAPGGDSIVYEAIASGCKEVFVHSLLTSKTTKVSSLGKTGDRLPVATMDRHLFYQSRSNTLEVYRADDDGKNVVTVTTGSSGGLRRPSTDAHGHVVVFQAANAGGTLEVWCYRYCPEVTLTRYGTHDKPSLGKLESDDYWYRCDLWPGIRTSLFNYWAVWALGVRQTSVKIPGTGSSLYTDPLLLAPVHVPALGGAYARLPVPQAMKGTLYYQWFVFDASANALGIVGSEGTKASF
ncbi:MAG: hypothetical protein QGG14_10475 [Planctomycetota bacterium]|jgi:Tol biopolymer transport system component|nr:hypothetical protein [Planctomycetota bacterium]